MTARLPALGAAVAIVVTTLEFPSQPSNLEAQAPRVVAVGDVHGAFEGFVGILQAAGIIDAQRRWSGGTAVLIQTGDVFDRGAGVRETLDLLMGLEDEAKRAGGRVEALLGNHEMMNLLGDDRDVSAAAFAGFADARSENRRSRAYDDYVRLARRRAPKAQPSQTREEWMAAHPPGFVEYLEALGPRGKYGRWLRSHKVVTTVEGTAFMHAGVRAETVGTLEDVNRTAERDVAAWDEARAMMVQVGLVPAFCTLPEAVDAAAAEWERIAAALKANEPPGDHVTKELVERLQRVLQIGTSSLLDPEGPLWFRGFAQWPDTDEPRMAALVERFGVQRFVTGHTPSPPYRIRARFGNRVFLIDTGMFSTYFKGGRASALELEGGRITAIYEDSREVLVPTGAYLRPLPFFEPVDRPRSAGAASAAAR
jgi:Calcineurin-like phosphoesterase